ncbi:hypothetical protein CR203_00485 [Salipaludibacillus neizhouensis]|uniref:Post-transcriptional regulator n=2 Tax=Salipaludibacillus TaxID=1884449 RepID=A0A3A9KL67_9BACI|nr:post-transcriptional regulator [Salipaludibacillus neizhouensis]RKL68565.1 hypothetical protein CR203_00485 [Salipaludibacillus neizhouensis]
MTKEQWGYWKLKLEPVIESKAEEWHILGYDRVTEKEVWECFLTKLEKNKERPEPVRSHWMVAELFHLKANDYMTWLTIEAYKGPEWFENEEPIDFSLKSFHAEDI